VPATTPSSSIPRRDSRTPAPLSFAQQRLWFLDQLVPGTSLYNVPEAYALRGPLDVAALEGALQQIVERHEVLRTRFEASNGEPTQRVESVTLTLPVTDLSARPESGRKEEARAVAAAETERPFDLTRAPLLRAHLIRLAAEEHWLLVTLHHIVSDDWSLGILFSELSELYRARVQGRSADLPDLPIQYADFAVWQRRWLQGPTLSSRLAYWKERLAGDSSPLSLPTDRPRPAVPSFRGAEHRRRIGSGLAQALKDLSSRERSTLYMTLLAAFQTFLARHCGQTWIAVGTPIAGRTRFETENLIGFFVNTLVMKSDLSDDPTFLELLRRVRDTSLEAYAHQDLPFEKLVEELRPDRSLAYSPIVQTMFELDSAPDVRLALPGLEVEPVDLADASAKFDLRLLAASEDAGLLLIFEYATDLFDESTIERMAANFEALLEGIVADPDRAVSRLPMLSSAERRRLLVEWNQTEADYPRDKTVHALFEEQAAATPDAVAISFGEETRTYRELDRMANQLAGHLRSLGVGPETLVGVCLPRSLDMVVAVLGILKSGGAYVPIDPGYPSDRVAFMLADSEAPVLVTHAGVAETLPPFEGTLVRLDADREAIFGRKRELADPGVGPSNLAYVMYTSGSTGRPKGVEVPHRGVVNYLWWCLQQYDIAGGRGAPLQSSLSFDLTVTALFGPLLSGRRVFLLPEGFAAEALGAALRSEKDFSFVKLTPTRLDLLTQEIPAERAPGATRAFVIGGEALRAESLRFWRERAPSTALYNEYGPTETVVGCAIYRVAPEDPASGPVPIGRPIANARLYVLDSHGEPVPIGVVGELVIGGEGVARGYWKRPELTAERFIADTFSAAPGPRLYRSGDLARYRPDGVLEYLGRSDDQVKVRGFRVEFAEIEMALRDHSAVFDAAAAIREETPGDRRLVAYVVPKPGLPWNVEAFRQHLLDRLPDYMVPSAFVRLDELPVTGNGKLDRQALPSPNWRERQLDSDYTPPRDALELHLAKIWERALQTSPIGLDDDFFDLGGHSLLAVRLFAEIEEATGTKLPLATLFQAPTVGQIAEVLRSRGGASQWISLVPIQPRGARPPFYCVHAAGGSVMPYRALATRLGPNQPFYGLQARGLDDAHAAPERIEDMAEQYIEEILRLQPDGPYYLGGHSAGGLVAYEMAKRLRERGKRIAFLALFDTWAPGHGELITQKYVAVRAQQYVMKIGRFLRKLSEGDAAAYLREKLRVRMRVLQGKTSNLPPKLQDLRDSIEEAADNYQATEYPGTVTLFRAERQPPEYALDRTLGWADLALGGVEVHEVPGFHGEIVEEPQAAILAEQVRGCLHRVGLDEEKNARSSAVSETEGARAET
jgi:amino acid adenylation domain-containing protein